MIHIERRHFGVLIPSTNITVEIEYTRHLPAMLQFHVGRCGKGANTPFSSSLDDDVIRQPKLLGDAKVEVITLAQTSARLFDDDYDARVKAQMSSNAGVPAVTSAKAIEAAVRALGMKRIGIVTPYSVEVIQRAKRYSEMKYDAR
jgi:maleate isomerase